MSGDTYILLLMLFSILMLNFVYLFTCLLVYLIYIWNIYCLFIYLLFGYLLFYYLFLFRYITFYGAFYPLIFSFSYVNESERVKVYLK